MSELLDTATALSDDGPFMNDRQKEYFRRKLLAWKSDILRESRETLEALANESSNLADAADLGDVGLDDVEGAAFDERDETLSSSQDFATCDGDG